MDPIWLCVTTILLHVLINRLFGRLPGWPRLAHWPAMQIAAMSVHALLASSPISWLLQWSSDEGRVAGSFQPDSTPWTAAGRLITHVKIWSERTLSAPLATYHHGGCRRCLP
jgi:hypothetical protein